MRILQVSVTDKYDVWDFQMFRYYPNHIQREEGAASLIVNASLFTYCWFNLVDRDHICALRTSLLKSFWFSFLGPIALQCNVFVFVVLVFIFVLAICHVVFSNDSHFHLFALSSLPIFSVWNFHKWNILSSLSFVVSSHLQFTSAQFETGISQETTFPTRWWWINII